MIHSETTSGLINPIDIIGTTLKDINPKVFFNKTFDCLLVCFLTDKLHCGCYEQFWSI